jgi:hypothetical protein
MAYYRQIIFVWPEFWLLMVVFPKEKEQTIGDSEMLGGSSCHRGRPPVIRSGQAQRSPCKPGGPGGGTRRFLALSAPKCREYTWAWLTVYCEATDPSAPICIVISRKLIVKRFDCINLDPPKTKIALKVFRLIIRIITYQFSTRIKNIFSVI